MPTVLHMLGVAPPDSLDGRVLTEALREGPDQTRIEVEERVFSSSNQQGPLTHLSISEVGDTPYINRAWVE